MAAEDREHQSVGPADITVDDVLAHDGIEIASEQCQRPENIHVVEVPQSFVDGEDMSARNTKVREERTTTNDVKPISNRYKDHNASHGGSNLRLVRFVVRVRFLTTHVEDVIAGRRHAVPRPLCKLLAQDLPAERGQVRRRYTCRIIQVTVSIIN